MDKLELKPDTSLDAAPAVSNSALKQFVTEEASSNKQSEQVLVDLHQVSSEVMTPRPPKTLWDKLIKTIAETPIIREFNVYTAYAAAFGNSISAATNFFNKILKLPEKVTNIATSLGKFSTTLSFVGLGVSSTLEHLNKKNYIAAFGHSIDNIVAFLPQPLTYLAHGFASGIYCLANSLSTSVSKSDFSSLGENLQYMQKAFAKCWEQLKTDPIRHMKNEKTGVLGVVASLVTLLGSALWKASGSPLFGATIRNLGEVLLLLNQLNPQNINSKPNYYNSGKWALGGTIVDYIAKIFENQLPDIKSILYPLSLALGAISSKDFIMYQRSSEVSNG